jgi:hypothetical protein
MGHQEDSKLKELYAGEQHLSHISAPRLTRDKGRVDIDPHARLVSMVRPVKAAIYTRRALLKFFIQLACTQHDVKIVCG